MFDSSLMAKFRPPGASIQSCGPCPRARPSPGAPPSFGAPEAKAPSSSEAENSPQSVEESLTWIEHLGRQTQTGHLVQWWRYARPCNHTQGCKMTSYILLQHCQPYPVRRERASLKGLMSPSPDGPVNECCMSSMAGEASTLQALSLDRRASLLTEKSE